MNLFRVGIDSTDSPLGGCTTWTAMRLMEDLRLIDPDINFIGYPRLIRLNPNVPNKTRGNAAVNFNFESKLDKNVLFKVCRSRIEQDTLMYSINDDKLPGLAILINDTPNTTLYWQAMQNILTLEEAKKLLIVDYVWPENSLGLIGALSSISADLSWDRTFELLSYRNAMNFGKPRIIDVNNLRRISDQFGSTFSSIVGKRELIAPSGPDPVYCGIRGDEPDDLVRFFDKLIKKEEIDKYIIFETNQGTDAHVKRSANKIKLYHVISSEAVVISNPEILQGSHVKIAIRLNSEIISALVFEPTKELAKKSKFLQPGDLIYIHGSINDNKNELVLNVEHIEILDLNSYKSSSPYCSLCNKKMTSAGFLSGYKCKSCNFKCYNIKRLAVRRSLRTGEKIYSAISAQRHLTRPLTRMNLRNHE